MLLLVLFCSWKKEGGWYEHVRSRAEEFAKLGFTAIWMPPPTQSVSKQVRNWCPTKYELVCGHRC